MMQRPTNHYTTVKYNQQHAKMFAENGQRGGNQFKMTMLSGANQPIGQPKPFSTNTGIGNKFSAMFGGPNFSQNQISNGQAPLSSKMNSQSMTMLYNAAGIQRIQTGRKARVGPTVMNYSSS